MSIKNLSPPNGLADGLRLRRPYADAIRPGESGPRRPARTGPSAEPFVLLQNREVKGGGHARIPNPGRNNHHHACPKWAARSASSPGRAWAAPFARRWGLVRARPRERGRAPAAVAQPPFGRRAWPSLGQTVPPPSMGAPAASDLLRRQPSAARSSAYIPVRLRRGRLGFLALGPTAPERAFLRFAPEGKPERKELKLSWTAMNHHQGTTTRRSADCRGERPHPHVGALSRARRVDKARRTGLWRSLLRHDRRRLMDL
jgi:hypothetical protein